MKILGEGYLDKYIVEIHRDELSNLLGFYSYYSAAEKDIKFRPGEAVEVSALYKDAEKLKDLKKQIETFREFFVECAEFYTKIKASQK